MSSDTGVCIPWWRHFFPLLLTQSASLSLSFYLPVWAPAILSGLVATPELWCHGHFCLGLFPLYLNALQHPSIFEPAVFWDDVHLCSYASVFPLSQVSSASLSPSTPLSYLSPFFHREPHPTQSPFLLISFFFIFFFPSVWFLPFSSASLGGSLDNAVTLSIKTFSISQWKKMLLI